jgi:hypothetical protein
MPAISESVSVSAYSAFEKTASERTFCLKVAARRGAKGGRPSSALADRSALVTSLIESCS